MYTSAKATLRLAAVSSLLLALAIHAPHDANAQAAAKTVTIVVPEEPDNLDLCNATRGAIGRMVRQNIGETLTERDPDTGAILPRLATSFEKLDPQTWRFHLRDGVKFSDGTPFNADAVVKALSRTMDTKLDCQTRTKMLDDLSFEYKIVDPLTVDIATKKPSPILPVYLSTASIGSPNTPPDKYALAPIGTGPYLFDHYTPGVEVVLKRNDAYWGKKPEVETARFIWRKESSVMAAMVAVGEADLAPSIAIQDARDPALDVAYSSAETTYMRLESQLPPLDDRRVRLALNYAIDRNALRGTIFSKDVTPATQLVFPSIAGHNHAIDKQVWPYDPAKAKQLLAEAKAAGAPVDRKLQIVGRGGFYPNAAEALDAIRSMWAAVGFNVDVKMVEVAEFINFNTHPYRGAADKAAETKAEDRAPVIMGHMHDNNNGDPVFTVNSKYACGASASPHCNPDLDKLIAQATSQSGPERTKTWEEVFRVIYESVYDVPLFHMVGYARVGKRINFKPTSASNNEVLLESIRFR